MRGGDAGVDFGGDSFRDVLTATAGFGGFGLGFDLFQFCLGFFFDGGDDSAGAFEGFDGLGEGEGEGGERGEPSPVHGFAGAGFVFFLGDDEVFGESEGFGCARFSGQCLSTRKIRGTRFAALIIAWEGPSTNFTNFTNCTNFTMKRACPKKRARPRFRR